MSDTIYRQAAIDALKGLEFCHYMECGEYIGEETIEVRLINAEKARDALQNLPSAQSKTSRIENALHGKSAEEQYDFIWWLLQNYAMNFTDSRQAAIEWLKGEQDG